MSSEESVKSLVALIYGLILFFNLETMSHAFIIFPKGSDQLEKTTFS